MNTTRDIVIVAPPPGKDTTTPDLTAALAAMAKAGINVRLVAHDAPEVLMAVASEHPDPEVFRHSAAIDNLMREMAIHPHDFGKTAEVADPLDALPFSPWPDAPVTSQGLPRKASQAKQRRRARRGGSR